MAGPSAACFAEADYVRSLDYVQRSYIGRCPLKVSTLTNNFECSINDGFSCDITRVKYTILYGQKFVDT